jgi:hypothetical protein
MMDNGQLVIAQTIPKKYSYSPFSLSIARKSGNFYAIEKYDFSKKLDFFHSMFKFLKTITTGIVYKKGFKKKHNDRD